jgi:hypothetical protein
LGVGRGARGAGRGAWVRTCLLHALLELLVRQHAKEGDLAPGQRVAERGRLGREVRVPVVAGHVDMPRLALVAEHARLSDPRLHLVRVRVWG